MAEDNPSTEGLQAELAAARARITELNNEAKGHRLNASNARTEAEAARTELERSRSEHAAALAAAEKRATDAQAAADAVSHQATQAAEAARTEANGRVLMADLRTAAQAAGMVDLDALKLLDTSAIKLGENGQAAIPDGFFAEAKKAKPYLFGTPPAHTSSPNNPPPNEPPKPKAAKDMTAEERGAFEKAHGIRA